MNDIEKMTRKSQSAMQEADEAFASKETILRKLTTKLVNPLQSSYLQLIGLAKDNQDEAQKLFTHLHGKDGE